MNRDASLPQDLKACQRELLAARSAMEHTEAVLAETAVTCDQQQAQLAKLQEELELLKRYLFGRRSERHAPDPRQGQLFIAPPDEAPLPPPIAEEEITYRRRKGHGWSKLPKRPRRRRPWRGDALILGWWRTWWPARSPIICPSIVSRTSWPAAAWS